MAGRGFQPVVRTANNNKRESILAKRERRPATILGNTPAMAKRSGQDWTRVGDALFGAGSLGEPAEIHGEFCGLACVMGSDAIRPWVDATLADADSRPEASIATLQDLAGDAWSALDAGEMSFQLLLPPDDESLERRAECLGLWCQGFMHGLGAAGSPGKDSSILKHEVIRDIVTDFSEITRAGFTEEETEEEGEAALIELIEFVRVGAQLVFEELQAIRSGATDSGQH